MTKKRRSRGNNETANDYYHRLAQEAWEDAWVIFKDKDNWREEAGTEAQKVCVSSKKISNLGKVFKVEALIEHTPQAVFDVLVPGVCDWPKWNPTILECHTVQVVDDSTDIRYSVGASQVGGLVSSRDFVNLCHWKMRDGIMMSSACGVTHPDMPNSKHHIRATNNPACYVFEQVANEPNKCQFTCILNTDLKGWLPQFLIDQAMSGVLQQYVTHLITHLDKLQQDPDNNTNSSTLKESTPSMCKDCKDATFIRTKANAETVCVH